MNKTGLIISILIIAFLSIIFTKTGFLQASSIDSRDLKHWNYSDGIIIGAEAYELPGNTGYCWIMVHGYGATPFELKELGTRINQELHDTIYGIRLQGHGEVPSKLQNLDMNYWYNQVHEEYKKVKDTCNNINVVGSSTGATIALKLAEEEQVHAIYLSAPFLKSSLQSFFGLSDILIYLKRNPDRISQIADPEGLKHNIAYVNLPLAPLKSYVKFLDDVTARLHDITEPTALFHSKNDPTSYPANSQLIYDSIASKTKKLIWYERSKHVLLQDYDKEDVINNIIAFEKQIR